MQLWKRFTELFVSGRLILGHGAKLVSGNTEIDLSQVGVVPTGADVALTGYVTGSADDVAATDSINDAIGKLEARIAAIENA